MSVADVSVFRWQALAWALAQQAHEGGFVLLLNNNTLAYPNDPFPNRLFIGAKRVISFPLFAPGLAGSSDAFQTLYAAHRQKPSYLAGYFGYDLKNQLEDLTSRHPNRAGFPDACFVEPLWVIDFDPDCVRVQGDNADKIVSLIQAFVPPANPVTFESAPLVQGRVTPDEYAANVRRIQDYILTGDVYELSYCIEFFLENARLNPMATYQSLNARSPMPFSGFLKVGNRYVMGASPERFLKKQGRKILSQPIKGTIRRGQNPAEDALLRTQLLTSEKERAENLMIVDLVRNDLARSAETGSVCVDELFGIYGFEQVYQMISTVSATLREGLSWADALRNAFPMGSMTGAPKIRAMQLIDEIEVSRRGVYSGALGFVTPDGDFDFSVVIRSLLYDAQSQYASFSVGSAITYDADPAHEWAECLLKARAIRRVLEG